MLVTLLATVVHAGTVARADFGDRRVPAVVRQMADDVMRTHDNGRLPFLLLDKTGARLYVFGSEGRLQDSAPVLLGLAIGDRAADDLGSRPLERIAPHERITPAGRFVAERGVNLRGEDVVWVDYDAGLSLHRVRATVPQERRLQRLATPTAADNRISYGCINVPATFFERSVAPVFAASRGVVYILPEASPLDQVFGFRARRLAGAGPDEARRATLPPAAPAKR